MGITGAPSATVPTNTNIPFRLGGVVCMKKYECVYSVSMTEKVTVEGVICTVCTEMTCGCVHLVNTCKDVRVSTEDG